MSVGFTTLWLMKTGNLNASFRGTLKRQVLTEMNFLTGTYDAGMRLRLSLHPDALGPLLVGMGINGHAERTCKEYLNYKKYFHIHLQARQMDCVYILPYPILHGHYRFNILIGRKQAEGLKENQVIATTPPMQSGVTYFELKLEEIVQSSKRKKN